MPTAGDQNVPVNTGITMARAAGILGSFVRDPERHPAETGWREIFAPDPRYGNAQAFRVFDSDAYMVSFTVRFLGSRGRITTHERGCDCVASRPFFATVDGVESNAALQGERQCVPGEDYRVCTPQCAEAWGLRTPEESACQPE